MYLEDKEVLKSIKKSATMNLIAPLLLIVFALVLFQNPDNFISVAGSIFGYGAIFVGVINSLLYFRLKGEEKVYSKKLTNALLMISFWITSFFQNALFSQIICVLLGTYIIYQNASQLTISLIIKDYQSKVWSYLFVMALVDIILGIVIVINPFPSSELKLYLASLIVISEFLVFMQNILILFGVKNEQKDK